MMSSLAAHLITLLMLSMSTPRLTALSQLNLSNPSASRLTDTRQTWAESMDWSLRPEASQSQVPCLCHD